MTAAVTGAPQCRNARPTAARGSSHGRAWQLAEGVAEAGSDSPMLADAVPPNPALSPYAQRPYG